MTLTHALLLSGLLALSPAVLFAQDALDDGAATVPATNPTEIRRGAPMGGSSEERGRRFYENVIRKVEPSLKGDLARLPLYIELFKREFIEDTRTFAIDITAIAMANDGVMVNGRVALVEHRRSLGEFLKPLGFVPDVDGVGLSPSAALGDRQYAIVRAEHALIYAKPVGPRETLTDSLKGDGLFLLAPADNGHFLCHAPDGYVGYVSGDAIEQ